VSIRNIFFADEITYVRAIDELQLGRESIFRQYKLKIWIEDSEGTQVTDSAVVPFVYCGGGFGIIFI
jgi:hypothetical protein